MSESTPPDEPARNGEHDIDDELRLHIDLHVQRSIDAGVDPAEARRRAARAFGAADRVRDEVLRLERADARRHRVRRAVAALGRDIGAASRALGRAPAFTLSAVATVALAIGVATSLLTIVNELVLRPVPGISTPNLVKLYVTRDGRLDGLTGFPRGAYLEMAGRSQTVDRLAASTGRGFAVSTDAGSTLVLGQLVSGTFFETLGTRTARGRLLGDDDDRPGRPGVAVISHAFWFDRLGADPEVIGRALSVNGLPFEVVGVSERGFRGPFIGFPTDLFVPLSHLSGLAPEVRVDDWNDDSLELLGRLAPAASTVSAGAEFDALAADLALAHPAALAGRGVEVRNWKGLDADLAGPVLGFVGVLSAIALLIVGVACVNIAGLLLHRGQARRAEFAVRQALGATRGALLRQLAVETLLIFIAGQAAGVALAASATRSLNRFLPESAIPIQLDLAVDWRVALLATGITLLCAVVFGLAPGLTASRVDPWTALRPSAAGAPGRVRLRRALVSAQFGASLVLLVVAGLFARTLSASEARSTGVTATAVAIGTADVRVLSLSESAGQAYFDAWLDAVRRSPGVTHAALARSLPVALGVSTSSITAEGVANPIGGHASASNVVSPGYFDALGIPMLTGRDFATFDRTDTEPVAIVSRATAVELFGAAEVVGRYLVESDERLRIVGVADDVAVSRPGTMDALLYYRPFAQRSSGRMSLVATASLDAPLDAIRLGAASANPLVPVIALGTFDARLGERFFAERMAASIAGVFGALGVVLAMVGLYAVVAFQAVARRRELAVRLALGASRRGIRRLVLTDGLRQAMTGVGAGLIAAWFLAAAIRGVVPGLSAADPAAFAGAALVLTIAAVIASDLPARRAAAADPMSTLRKD